MQSLRITLYTALMLAENHRFNFACLPKRNKIRLDKMLDLIEKNGKFNQFFLQKNWSYFYDDEYSFIQNVNQSDLILWLFQ